MNYNKKVTFYILGAGKPFNGKLPSSLININKSKNNLDWMIENSRLFVDKIKFISGYKHRKIKECYPNLNLFYNSEWRTTKSGFSFTKYLQEFDNECVVSYSDIIFHKYVLEKILQKKADIVIGTDKNWLYRYNKRPLKDIKSAEKVSLINGKISEISSKLELNYTSSEFIGLVKFSSRALEIIQFWKKNYNKNFFKQFHLIDLINLLIKEGLKVVEVDAQKGWAEMNYSFDLAKFMLGTKADTLNILNGIIKKSKTLKQISFYVSSWEDNNSYYINKIKKTFKSANLICVRSSSVNEDNFQTANAGKFLTFLNISLDKKKIKKTIDKVISSYKDTNPLNQILIQPMLKNVKSSGVIFTRLIETGSPYYKINIDEKSGLTDTITSGLSNNHRTFLIYKDTSLNNLNINPTIKKLIKSSKEIEDLVNYDALDIEFAINKNDDIYILQVRPIVFKSKSFKNLDKQVFNGILKSESKFLKFSKNSSRALGNKNIFGIMPDWNPAEIIGVKPNKLATSLYKHLILDEKWAKQRYQSGYRNLMKIKLLKVFSGHPYIDVRASLNSFIPKQVPEYIAKDLVNCSLKYLENNPELHDKVEFEVLPTCYTFNFKKWFKHFNKYSDLSNEHLILWKNSLKKITEISFHNTNLYFLKIPDIEEEFNLILKSKKNPLDKAFSFLELARNKGINNFSHLARASFISMTLLKSLVEIKVISTDEMKAFLNSIETISTEFTIDAKNCYKGKITFNEFLEKYGHLRPGTYDINSPSYKEDPDRFLKPLVNQSKKISSKSIKGSYSKIWHNARKKVENKFLDAGFNLSIEEIENYLKTSIQGRELSKFYFTKSLSYCLEYLKIWGKKEKISEHQIGNLKLLDIKKIKDKKIHPNNVKIFVQNKSQISDIEKEVVEKINFPPLICNKEEFYFFEYPNILPNYVGDKVLIEYCCQINNKTNFTKLQNKIVLIPNADPGFDWIFGHGISGLVTMYGGANSHMTIRSVEYEISAAIGVGKVLYEKLLLSSMIELDPNNRNIRILY